MKDQKFKLVRIKYKDGSQKRHGIFTLVTDIQYHDNYIVIEYYRRPESTSPGLNSGHLRVRRVKFRSTLAMVIKMVVIYYIQV